MLTAFASKVSSTANTFTATADVLLLHRYTVVTAVLPAEVKILPAAEFVINELIIAI
jgi:hypothetical protein